MTSYDVFLSEFRKVFGHLLQEDHVAKQLFELHQGTNSVTGHSIHFHIIATQTRLNGQALKCLFNDFLSDSLKG